MRYKHNHDTQYFTNLEYAVDYLNKKPFHRCSSPKVKSSD